MDKKTKQKQTHKPTENKLLVAKGEKMEDGNKKNK